MNKTPRNTKSLLWNTASYHEARRTGNLASGKRSLGWTPAVGNFGISASVWPLERTVHFSSLLQIRSECVLFFNNTAPKKIRSYYILCQAMLAKIYAAPELRRFFTNITTINCATRRTLATNRNLLHLTNEHRYGATCNLKCLHKKNKFFCKR